MEICGMSLAQSLNILVKSKFSEAEKCHRLRIKREISQRISGRSNGDAAVVAEEVIGILSAVVARRNTGVGQFVDVSLFASAVAMLASDAGTYFGSNHIPMRGTERLTGGWPHYSIYQTKDGEYLACGALEKKFWINR